MGQGITQVSISQIDFISIFSSAISIVLGIVAILLSILFFKMSDKSSKEAERSAHKIDTSVEKLEILFEKLYSGTFDMMKETVTDMREHVYSKSNMIDYDSEKINKEITAKVAQEVADTVKGININQNSDDEMKKIIMDVIEKSKHAEKDMRNNIVRDEIISFIRVTGVTTYPEIDNYLIKKGIVVNNATTLFNELEKLSKEKIINNPFDNNNENGDISISHSEKIFLL